MQEQLDRIFDEATVKKDRPLLPTKALIVRILETVQDGIVVSLCFGLFGVMTIQIRAMFFSQIGRAHV